jgi:hypothetical protein
LLHSVCVAEVALCTNNVGVNRIFMETHKQKSIGLRSGDRGGHDTGSSGTRPIQRPAECLPNHSRTARLKYALWGIVKLKVSQNRYQTTEQLEEAVHTAFQSLTPQMLRKTNHRTWRRIILCAENNGAHTDVIDV